MKFVTRLNHTTLGKDMQEERSFVVHVTNLFFHQEGFVLDYDRFLRLLCC